MKSSNFKEQYLMQRDQTFQLASKIASNSCATLKKLQYCIWKANMYQAYINK